MFQVKSDTHKLNGKSSINLKSNRHATNSTNLLILMDSQGKVYKFRNHPSSEDELIWQYDKGTASMLHKSTRTLKRDSEASNVNTHQNRRPESIKNHTNQHIPDTILGAKSQVSIANVRNIKQEGDQQLKNFDSEREYNDHTVSRHSKNYTSTSSPQPTTTPNSEPSNTEKSLIKNKFENSTNIPFDEDESNIERKDKHQPRQSDLSHERNGPTTNHTKNYTPTPSPQSTATPECEPSNVENYVKINKSENSTETPCNENVSNIEHKDNQPENSILELKHNISTISHYPTNYTSTPSPQSTTKPYFEPSNTEKYSITNKSENSTDTPCDKNASNIENKEKHQPTESNISHEHNVSTIDHHSKNYTSTPSLQPSTVLDCEPSTPGKNVIIHKPENSTETLYDRNVPGIEHKDNHELEQYDSFHEHNDPTVNRSKNYTSTPSSQPTTTPDCKPCNTEKNLIRNKSENSTETPFNEGIQNNKHKDNNQPENSILTLEHDVPTINQDSKNYTPTPSPQPNATPNYETNGNENLFKKNLTETPFKWDLNYELEVVNSQKNEKKKTNFSNVETSTAIPCNQKDTGLKDYSVLRETQKFPPIPVKFINNVQNTNVDIDPADNSVGSIDLDEPNQSYEIQDDLMLFVENKIKLKFFIRSNKIKDRSFSVNSEKDQLIEQDDNGLSDINYEDDENVKNDSSTSSTENMKSSTSST